jgi:hypothetical protein
MGRARQVGAKSVPQPKPLKEDFCASRKGQRHSERVLKKQVDEKKSRDAIGR